MTAPPNAHVDLLAPTYLADPHPTLAALRSSTPIAYVEAIDAFVVTSHELVSAILADPETFSNRRHRLGAEPSAALREQLAAVRADGWEHRPVIADEDPPLHDAFRDVVAPFFTPSRMRELVPAMTRICDELIDGWEPGAPVEFVRQFSSPLPLRAIAVLLDLPTDDPAEQVEQFGRWRDAAIATVGSALSDDEALAAERDVVAMQRYLAARIEAAADPERDVFAALREARIEHPVEGRRALTMEEMLTIARQIFVGGVETTTKALAELMLQLDDRPALFDAMRDAGTRRRILEESLRLSSPAQGIMRVATRDVSVGGCDVPAGAHLLVMFAAANRDPEVIECPDVLDPARPNTAQHLAFGRGVHVCLGAAFARTEMQAALDVLSRRIASYRVLDREAVRYHRSFILRGPDAVWLDVELATG